MTCKRLDKKQKYRKSRHENEEKKKNETNIFKNQENQAFQIIKTEEIKDTTISNQFNECSLDFLEEKIFSEHTTKNELIFYLNYLKINFLLIEKEKNQKVEMKIKDNEKKRKKIKPDFEISLDIFKKILNMPSFDFDILILTFQEYEIENFISEIRNSTIKERLKITRIIQLLLLKFDKLRNLLKLCICNEITYYLENGKNLRHIHVLLELCAYLIGKDLFSCYNELEDFIRIYVLNLLTNSNAFMFTVDVNFLFKNICLRNEHFMSLVFDYFLKIFLDSNTPTKILIMNLTFEILNETYKDIEPYSKHIITYLNHAFKEQNFLLINTTKLLIELPVLKITLKASVKHILPEIFFNLYNLSKTYWNKDDRGFIFEMIRFFMMMDKSLFDKCLFEYNKTQYGLYMEEKIFDNSLYIENKYRKIENNIFERRKSVVDPEFEEHKRIRRENHY